jgi:hypothetical protein
MSVPKFLRCLIAILLYLSIAPARAQMAVEQAMGAAAPLNQNLLVRDRAVSAPNTALTQVYDLGNTAQVLAIHAVCASGTATLTVSASSDNVNFLTIDSLIAASPQIKFYNNSTLGATTAVSPLAFRWIKVSMNFCPSGSSTLTVAAK